MNILVTVDSNYIRPLKVMLTSFFVYHRNENRIYLLYSNVRDGELAELKELVEKNNSRFLPVRMDEGQLAEVPVFRYFTKEMYYRLFAGVMFPSEKRILYLDPDIMIRGSLISMYETDLEGNILAGIPDYAINRMLSAHKVAIGFKEEEQYINSGVLLMDLDKMRENFQAGYISHAVEEWRERLEYPDQDIINLIFRGRIKLLERKYNYNTGYGSEMGMLFYILGGFLLEKNYPKVVHYMGAVKPWHPQYCGKFAVEYHRYLKIFPETDPEKARQWNRRYITIGKHLLAVVKRKLGGRDDE
ncbi:MAG: glycosyltransferase family 8 protein [Lachnospiraceae bacterium]|nr:glycosyltransferase family 8 protein [Lachnospiraceae bacterium]